jgi:chorismate mutase/prephenate dehydratase
MADGGVEDALAAARAGIDRVDGELLRLLCERARLVLDVARIKHSGGAAPAAYYRPEREAQILARVVRDNPGPLDAEAVAQLFREIISCCRALEQSLSVAYLGPPGTFGQAALVRHFGHFARALPCVSIGAVFREVEAGNAHYGIVPVENSTEGLVSHTHDCLARTPLAVCGEVALRVHQCLLAAPATEPAAITRIYSHQQSLAQCRQWLDAHWPAAERVAVASNGEAARLVAGLGDAAAIAGALAADLYGLRTLAANIEDEADNTTRFLVIGSQRAAPSGRDKTSILVSARNESGALYRVLAPFHAAGISLLRLESRPARTGSWSYVFFIDFNGHAQEPRVAAVLAEVAAAAIDVRVLGSYPQAVP